MRLTSPRLLEVNPGTVVTLAFLVSNHTGEPEELSESPEFDKPLQLLSPAPGSLPLSSDLGPKEAEPRVVALLVPAGCAAGKYEVRYGAASRRHPALSDSDSFTVVVSPVEKVQVVLRDKPDTVIAGTTYGLEYRVFNRGNLAMELDFSVASSPEYGAIVEPTRLQLPAGSSGAVRVTVPTPGGLRAPVSQAVTLQTRIGTKGREPISSETALVRILPLISGTYDPYHRIPVRVTVGALAADGPEQGSAVWGEISGGGTLDEAGLRHVEFLARGPDTRRVERFGQREEFRVAYWDPSWSVRLGDAAFSLSPLTESLRWGRGAQGTVTDGRRTVGLLHVTDPDGKLGSETGGFVSYQPLQALKLQANVLTKRAGGASSLADATLYTIQVGGTPGKWLAFGTELGASKGSREGESERTGTAYRADAAGTLPTGVQYALQKTRAGSDYFGYHHDVETSSADVIVPLSARLRGNLSMRAYANNLARDTRDPTATREWFGQAGLSYNFSRANVRLDLERVTRRDELQPADYDYSQKLIRLGLGVNGRLGNIQTSVARGIVDDRLTETRRDDLEQYSVYAQLRPTDRQSYSLFARTGHDGFTGSPRRTRTGGIDATWLFPGSLRAGLGWRRDDPVDGSPSTQMYANLAWERPNGHTVTARVEETQTRDDARTAGYLTYSVPFGIAVAKKQSIGTLRGRIREGDSPDGAPVAGVIVYVEGATAVTDARGEFLFPALRPGTYQLFLDPKSIGLGRVPTVKMPRPVTIRPGEEERVEFGVAPAARLCGRVFLAEREASNGVGEFEGRPVLFGTLEQGGKGSAAGREGRQGLGNVLVGLAGSEETRREFTDAGGLFCFRDLRPGTWTLSPQADGLPQQHAFERDRAVLQLAPGTEVTVDVKVLPRSRTIRMVDEGEIAPPPSH